MSQNFIILILSSTLLSCNNSVNTTNENSKSLTATEPIDNSDFLLRQSSESISQTQNNIDLASLNYQKIEKFDYNWSDSKSVSQLLKEGFEVKQDSSSSGATKYIFTKSNPMEIVEIVNNKSDDGAKSFILSYYLTSKTAYDNFFTLLVANKFKFNNRSNRYEKFIGTYEDLYISPIGQISKNNGLYYSIKYFHSQGKELSAPTIIKR